MNKDMKTEKNDFVKLTGEEILEKIENSGLSISEYAHEGVSDIDFFEDYSDELKVHIAKVKELNWSDRKQYEKLVLEGARLIDMQKKEFEAAGSPKIVGEVKEIEQYGGEDMGSTWYTIKHFVDHGVYIKTEGYYQSYNGTDFHEGYGQVVTQKQKTITVFE